MNTEKIKTYLQRTTPTKLSSFIGKENMELLVECNFNNVENILSSKNLCDMLLALKGEKIFEDLEIRTELLRQLSDEEIIKLADTMHKQFKDNSDINNIIEEFANTKWKISKVVKVFLDFFEIDADKYFKRDDYSYEVSVEEVCPGQISESNKRFFELQDYQFIIKQQSLNRLKNNYIIPRNILIRMPTGTGKTKTSMHIITNYIANIMENEGIVLWITDRRELLEQACNSFKNTWEHLGNEKIKLYRLWDKYDFNEEEIEDGIMFASIQKLERIRNKSKYEKIHEKVKLIIYDEAHVAMAPETRKILRDLNCRDNVRKKYKPMIGLTATPGRTDELESKVLSDMFDNYSIDINPTILNQINLSKNEYANFNEDNKIIKYLQERRILSKLETKQLEYEGLSKEELKEIFTQLKQIKDGKDFPEKILKKIETNKSRNKAILKELKELDEKGIPTIVFACSIEHGKTLSAILTMNGIYNVEVYGETSNSQRKENIKKFKNNEVKILINYGVLTTGFDSTNIKCVLITRPTNSVSLYSQMIGRGLRGPEMGGNETCLLIDIQDNLKQYSVETAFEHFNKFWGGK